jgi:hypothetical protein
VRRYLLESGGNRFPIAYRSGQSTWTEAFVADNSIAMRKRFISGARRITAVANLNENDVGSFDNG